MQKVRSKTRTPSKAQVPNLHVVEEANFIHVIDVIPDVLVQQLPDFREYKVDSVHVHRELCAHPEKMEGIDSIEEFECFQPTIRELKWFMTRMQAIQDL